MKHFTQFITRRVLAAMVATASILPFVQAQIPVNYYNSCINKSGAELKTALHVLLYNHNEVSSYSNLPNYFRKTDVYPPGDSRYGQWWDMYSDIPLRSSTFSGLNREHAFPKSWWGGSTGTPAYVDLNHLYPAEARANQAKSNYPLGEVQQPALFDNSITKVGYPVNGQGGGAKEVFEPDDEYKGDFARTYFYMVTCYQNLSWKYTYMVSNNTYPTLNNWSIDLLMKWHRADPVSEKEKNRNEEVYRVQSNRNPFIDYPELADYLWGSRKGSPWTPGSVAPPVGEQMLIAPVNGLDLDFGQNAVGDAATSTVLFRGENLQTDIAVAIIPYSRGSNDAEREQYKKMASMFTIDVETLSKANINSPSGVYLRVTYTPTEVGDHLAKLSIEGDPNEASREVVLRGTGCPVPTLSRLTAYEASNVTSTGYTATWSAAPEEEDVDYYVLTRTIINGATSTVETIEAETNEYEISGCTPGTQEVYTVQSAKLGHLSDPSNSITVNLESSGIVDVETDNPLGWVAYSGGIRIICGEPHTGVMIYDAMGRLIRVIDYVENNTTIDLPYGAFFIVTDQQRTPARIVVRP